MTNLRLLQNVEKVEVSLRAWRLFLTGFAPANKNDTAVAQMLTTSLETNQWVGNRDAIDHSQLKTPAFWIRALILYANEDSRRKCTDASSILIEKLARQYARTNHDLMKAIRNV